MISCDSLWFSLSSLRDSLKEIQMFIRAFSLEIYIHTTDYSSYEYIKDSASHRELQIGKIKIMISSKVTPQFRGLMIEL